MHIVRMFEERLIEHLAGLFEFGNQSGVASCEVFCGIDKFKPARSASFANDFRDWHFGGPCKRGLGTRTSRITAGHL